MNASDAAAASSSGAVINPQFCLPYAIDFAFTTKPPGDKSCHLAAVDAAGNVVFKYKKSSWSNSIRLVDAAGHVLVKMKAKDWSMHGRWQAFAGDSTDQKDLLFSIKRSSILQLHDQWVVYLAANKKEEACDFTITGNYRKKNNIIYKGDSSFVVAQLTKEHKLNLPLKKHAFGASISANCDHSFVAALILILDADYHTKQRNNHMAGAAAGAAYMGGAAAGGSDMGGAAMGCP